VCVFNVSPTEAGSRCIPASLQVQTESQLDVHSAAAGMTATYHHMLYKSLNQTITCVNLPLIFTG